MLFRPNPSLGVPIYLQLMEQVKHAVETGALRPGEQLPGIRPLAEELVINPNTVAKAYRGLDLDVPAGSIFGFLGRNGAGKTTTIKILLGMTRPTAGRARVFGLPADAPESSVEIRRRTGFVSEDKELYEYMTVDEIVRFTAACYPKSHRDLEQRYLRAF